ncbi:MAG: hypothetical protein LBD60_01345 [Puniceicoccales bacterium]|jgi:hypothetical protein|nr:hypothetical protein [Puniceicoccales bacterium]
MVKKHSKNNGFSNFCFATSGSREEQQLEGILQKDLKDYRSQEEVQKDLQFLEDVEACWIGQGEPWRLPVPGMGWRRLELKILVSVRNIESVIGRIRDFLQKKRERYRSEGEYRKEIEEIYSNHGASDTEEKVFYENVIFLKEIRSGHLYGDINQKLGEVNTLLRGMAFWEGS